jgi:hypothetical protein
LDTGKVGLPPQPGGRGDEADGRSSGQEILGQETIDDVAMTDEVDLLDARCTVGHARTREERINRTSALIEGSIDRVSFTQVHMDGGNARE